MTLPDWASPDGAALWIRSYTVGPLRNNCYLVVDPATQKAGVVDPSMDAGVVLDTTWGDAERDEALRVGMRPDRFFSVLPAETSQALLAARRAGRRIVAVETSGDSAPWEVDLAKPVVVLVGSETTGIPEPFLEAVDEVVSIPIGGFIPSYNVQAAVGILLGEWMRQNA